MNFEIAAFTTNGKYRKINQDRVSVNNVILAEGFLHVQCPDTAFCFVADGVGGGNAGDIASQMLLQFINEEFIKLSVISQDIIVDKCKLINSYILNASRDNPEYLGMASTLAGIIIKNDTPFIFSAGDSPVWICRDNTFFKLSKDHVFNENDDNSPITSYFGGRSDNLSVFFTGLLRELLDKDLFLICSDGLLRELNPKDIKSVLKQDIPLKEKMQLLHDNSLLKTAEDNISAVLLFVNKNIS